MRARSRISGRAGDRTTWLILLVIMAGVLLPAACVIWFMTEAARNQTDAARQRLSDALHGQLRLLGDRVAADWQSRVARLHTATGVAASDFHRIVMSSDLDSIVLLDGRGSPVYPALSGSALTPDRAEPRPDWQIAAALEDSGSYAAAGAQYAAIAARERNRSLAAVAAQAHVRALVRARDTAGALRAIETHFSPPRMASSVDRQGRLIAADAHLLAVHLIEPSDPRFGPLAQRLAAELNDYVRVTMPSSQRLFLMNELQTVAGKAVSLPTFAAERLAVEFLERDGAVPEGEGLDKSRVPDVWKMPAGPSAVALFRTETVVRMADELLKGPGVPMGVRFAMLPPGRDGGMEAIPASPWLPGWRIGFSQVDADRVDDAARQRVSTYVWAGSLAVAGLTIAGLLLWQAFRRLHINRLRTDLVAAVSHELRTPLASMRALVDLMLDDPGIDRATTHEYLQMIAGENARLSRLIEHFMAFSRVDRNGHGLVFRDVSVAALVREAASGAAGRQRFPGLDVELHPDLPPLYGDEDALVTVLLNLLENAYKYTGDDKRIVLRARQNGTSVVFEVQDNGVGIGRRDRRRIFRPFYQVDQRLARERGGCGLGLSIVEFIVRAHGGQVGVESEPGTGSLFSVVLPSRMAGRKAVA